MFKNVLHHYLIVGILIVFPISIYFNLHDYVICHGTQAKGCKQLMLSNIRRHTVLVLIYFVDILEFIQQLQLQKLLAILPLMIQRISYT